MTHYYVNYEGMVEPAKSAKALQDIKDYLGVEMFNNVTDAMKETIYPFEQFQMTMMFMAGIEGYPVKAWYEHVYGQGTAVVVDAEQPTETEGI